MKKEIIFIFALLITPIFALAQSIGAKHPGSWTQFETVEEGVRYLVHQRLRSSIEEFQQELQNLSVSEQEEDLANIEVYQSGIKLLKQLHFAQNGPGDYIGGDIEELFTFPWEWDLFQFRLIDRKNRTYTGYIQVEINTETTWERKYIEFPKPTAEDYAHGIKKLNLAKAHVMSGLDREIFPTRNKKIFMRRRPVETIPESEVSFCLEIQVEGELKNEEESLFINVYHQQE